MSLTHGLVGVGSEIRVLLVYTVAKICDNIIIICDQAIYSGDHRGRFHCSEIIIFPRFWLFKRNEHMHVSIQ